MRPLHLIADEGLKSGTVGLGGGRTFACSEAKAGGVRQILAGCAAGQPDSAFVRALSVRRPSARRLAATILRGNPAIDRRFARTTQAGEGAQDGHDEDLGGKSSGPTLRTEALA